MPTRGVNWQRCSAIERRLPNSFALGHVGAYAALGPPSSLSKGTAMNVRRVHWFLAVLGVLATTQTVAAQHFQGFFLGKGDVVVMMGDSITEQRLYSNYVEIWSQTRFPAYNLVFRNVGIGGDRSVGGTNRFKRDVLEHKPTVLTVDFGMNDGGYQPFNEKLFETYMKGLQGIADQAKAANIRVAWITPQPVEHNPSDAATKEAYNDTLEKFGAGVGEIAKKNAGLFIDQFHPYWAVISKARADGEKGRITAGDAVHPGPPGQALMAAAILKGLGFPRHVSAVNVKCTDNGCTVHGDRCIVTGASGNSSGFKFERKDLALPFFPEQARSILKWAPLLEEMNEYPLKVTGLKAGKYEVTVGGKKVAEHTDAELAQGVNLAAAVLSAGPVADQVKDVVKAITDKTNYYHGQIYSPLVLQRNIAKNPDFKDVAKEDVAKRRDMLIAERMQRMPEYDAAVRKSLETREHRFEIVPAK
jgi:lysophospholipase L1-like esterase